MTPDFDGGASLVRIAIDRRSACELERNCQLFLRWVYNWENFIWGRTGFSFASEGVPVVNSHLIWELNNEIG